MRTLMTATAVAVLAWLPLATPASAQDSPRYPFAAPPGMIHTEDGWREATVEEALEALERESESGTDWRKGPTLPAAAILRQTLRPRPAAELDAFADGVAAMMADATLPEHVRSNARGTLASAANLDPGSILRGTPYARAFDLLVRAYESGVDVLHHIVWVDPERGPAYVRGVLEWSERPPICQWRYDRDDGWLSAIGWWTPDTPLPGCDGYDFWEARDTPWCEAGGLLYRDIVYEAIQREWGGGVTMHSEQPTPVPPGLPEHVDDWYRRCR